MILLCLALACVSAPGRSAQFSHQQRELAIYNTLQLDHSELPYHASRRIRSDYWKAQLCYLKFTENKVAGCDKELIRLDEHLKKGK